MRPADIQSLHQLKNAVENTLAWGDAREWTQRDFETLSDRVYALTGTRISVSTLKRVWRSEYQSLPQRATLDALSRFAGAQDWGDFRALSETGRRSGRRTWRRLWPLPVTILAVVAAMLLIRSQPAGLQPGLDTVTFTARNVAVAGVPNTVIFDYDISSTRADSAVLQQSWDVRQRVKLPHDKSTYTSVYYYPGFHRASLIIGDSVVARRNVHVDTDGWMALVRPELNDLVPVYAPSVPLVRDGIMRLTPQDVAGLKGPISPSHHYVSYYNVRDFGGLTGDDFQLSLRVKNPAAEGGLTGQYVSIILMNEDARHIIPLSIPGCVGNIRVKFGDVVHRGRDHDLSAFGCDLNDWREVLVTVSRQQASVYIDDLQHPAYSLAYEKPVGRIMGLHFLFYGSGAVDEVTLKGPDGGVNFFDDFSR